MNSYDPATIENPIKKWEEDLNRHFSKTHRQPTDTDKDVQHHCQGNINQNPNEISPHWYLEWLLSRGIEMRNVGEVVEKREHLYNVGETVNCCSHYGKKQRFPQNLRKICHMTQLLLFFCYLYIGYENTNLKRYMHSYVYCNIIYNSQDKQPKCLLLNEW